MCGLAGFVGAGDTDCLHRMVALLRHRGPDACGVWLGDDAGLAHTRLSIQDLSQAGAQPMSVGNVHLSFNGEVYNAPRLRDQLIASGHHFRGHSDTEVILRGYIQWGEAVVARLSGMFAIAIWDDKNRSLLLARDRVGIKPLFYAERRQGLVFGSEIKALFAHPELTKQLNRPMIDAYLALGYVPQPQTIFEEVRVLPPAHLLLWRNGRCRVERYWQLPSGSVQGSEAELIDELDRRLNDAVAAHLLSDVEIGAFLSGGIDSSLVCAIAARQMDQPLRTFTIGFDGGGDERGWARMVAKHIGSKHCEHIAGLDLVEKLPQLLQSLEQPLFDNSILPTFLVSQVASKHVKAVLSGDGGDEPFLGYEWTRRALSLPRLLPSLPFSGWKWAYRAGAPGLLQRAVFDLSHEENDRYLRRMTASREFRYFLYTDDYRASLAADPINILSDRLQCAAGSERFAATDLAWYLPEDVLFKVDRISMAHGLEVRVPLLDHQLVEWMMQLPLEMRFRAGRGKYLLRKVAARYLPAKILQPRKQGFTIPVGHWLRGELGCKVEAMFASPEFANRGIIRPERAMDLLKMHRSGRFELGHRIWSLVMLEQWFRVWMDSPGGEGV